MSEIILPRISMPNTASNVHLSPSTALFWADRYPNALRVMIRVSGIFGSS
jgi:hypothetical protein